MAKLQQITPMLLAADLEASLAFFETVLGFKTRAHQREFDYAYLVRDNVAIRLLGAGPGAGAHDEKRQVHCYIDVDDVDALYAELKPELDTPPKGRVRPPHDTEYGHREFPVPDPDTPPISFRRATTRRAASHSRPKWIHYGS